MTMKAKKIMAELIAAAMLVQSVPVSAEDVLSDESEVGLVSTEADEVSDEVTDVDEPSDEVTDVDEPSDEVTDVDEPSDEVTDVDEPSDEVTDVDEPSDEVTDVDEPSDEVTDVDEPSDETADEEEDETDETGDADPEKEGAKTFTVGDLTYSVNEGEAVVTNYSGSAASVNVPTTVTDPEDSKVKYAVVSVGATFRNNAAITSVTMSSVKAIDAMAFENCLSLKSISAGGAVSVGIGAFTNCAALTSVTLGKAESIGSSAFEGCTSLTTITLNSAITVDRTAFSGCTKLSSLTLGKLPAIESSMFEGCKNLKSINAGSAVSVGDKAFKNCEALTTINLGKAEKIGSSAFEGCVSLSNAALNSAVSIGERAFYGCSKLGKFNFGENVAEIGEGAFDECSAMTTFTVDSKNTSYSVVDGILYNYDKITLILCPRGKISTEKAPLVLPDGLKKISARAFYGCRGLEILFTPPSITEIGDDAFTGCTGLTVIDHLGSVAQAAAERDGVKFHDVFYFDFVEDTQSATLSRYAGKYDLTVTVPDKATDDYGKVWPVTVVGDNAFLSDPKVETVILQKGITGLGKSTFRGCTALTTVEMPDTLTWINERDFEDCRALVTAPLTNKITEIRDRAFADCTNLETATFYSSITEIGASAFRGCEALKAVDLSENQVTDIFTGAFESCTALEKVTLSERLQTIYPAIFAGCVSLTEIVIPDKVTQILGLSNARGAFENCEKLENVTMSKNVTLIGQAAFSGCKLMKGFTLPYCLIEVGDSAFRDCESFNATLPQHIQSIGRSAFAGCISLPSVTFSGSIPFDIGSNAFEGCTSIGKITFDQAASVKLGSNAFSGCTSAAELKITAIGDVTIGAGAFSSTGSGDKLVNGCNSLESAVFTCLGKLDIGNQAFKGLKKLSSVSFPADAATIKIGNEAFMGDSGITELTLPNNITAIGDSAFRATSISRIVVPENMTLKTLNKGVFAQCYLLSDVTIPDTITKLADGLSGTGFVMADKPTEGDGVFSDCVSLKKITLPKTMTDIGSYAFSGCTGLENIVIPDSVKKVGNYAYFDCRSAKDIVFGKSLTTLGNYAFEGCLSITELELPEAKLGTGTFGAMLGLKTLILHTDPKKMFDNKNAYEFNNSFYENVFMKDSPLCLYTFYGGQQVAATEELALANVYFDSGVETINAYSFLNCSTLENIFFSEDVKTIERYAFQYCTSLVFCESIPRSVTAIGDSAFNGCTELKVIVIPPTAKLGTNVFAGIVGLTIFGAENSSAQEHAKKGNEAGEIKFVPVYQMITGLTGEIDTAEAVASLKWKNVDPQVSGYPISDLIYDVYRTDVGSAQRRKVGSISGEKAVDGYVSYEDATLVRGLSCTYTIEARYKITANNGKVFEINTASNDLELEYPSWLKFSNYPTEKIYDGKEFANPTSAQYKITADGKKVGSPVFVWYKGSVDPDNKLASAPIDAGEYILMAELTADTGEKSYTPSDTITIKKRVQSISESKAGTVYVQNKTEKSYQVDLDTISLPVLGKGLSYGDITFSDPELAIFDGMDEGYNEISVFLYDDLLTLGVPSVDDSGTLPREVGNVLITVASTNYENFKVRLTLKITNEEVCTVTFDTNGGTSVPAQYIEKYSRAKTPSEPTKTGYKFVGWYKDKECTEEFIFTSDSIIRDTVLYAKWAESALPMPELIKSTAGVEKIKVVCSKVVGATNYKLFYTTDNGKTYKKVGDAKDRTWLVTGLKAGVEYKFLVLTYNGSLWSEYIKGECYAAAVPKSSAVPQPETVKSSAGVEQVTVVCSTVPGATNYRLYYTTDNGQKYVTVGDTTSRKWVVKKLKAGTEYKFLVRAYKGGKWSDYKKGDCYAAATPKSAGLPKPATVKATPGKKRATVVCSAVAGAKTYRLFYTVDNGKNYVKVSDTKDRKWVVTGLTPGKEYKFLVLAYDGSKWSAYTKGECYAAVVPTK